MCSLFPKSAYICTSLSICEKSIIVYLLVYRLEIYSNWWLGCITSLSLLSACRGRENLLIREAKRILKLSLIYIAQEICWSEFSSDGLGWWSSNSYNLTNCIKLCSTSSNDLLLPFETYFMVYWLIGCRKWLKDPNLKAFCSLALGHSILYNTGYKLCNYDLIRYPFYWVKYHLSFCLSILYSPFLFRVEKGTVSHHLFLVHLLATNKSPQPTVCWDIVEKFL